jgi:hypothetical protein
MANERKSTEAPQNSAASSGNYGQSGLKNTQTRNEETMSGGAGGGVQGNPESSGNRSGGQGDARQQSGVDTNDGASSRQTRSAQDEEGQAS